MLCTKFGPTLLFRPTVIFGTLENASPELNKNEKILYQISLSGLNLSIKHGQTPPLCMVIGFLLPHFFVR